MANNPYLPFPAKIISVVKQTAIDWTFRLESGITPVPGQFMELSIPGVGEAPVSISDYGPGWLDMTIRKVGRLTNAMFELEPGDILYMRGPYGNGFSLERFQGDNLLIVAGGTGLAPVKSVISHFCRHRDQIRGFDLILGFKSPSDILFKDEIEAWREFAGVILTVDRGEDDWQGCTGVVTRYIDDFKFHSGTTGAIVVGPPLMMKFSTLSLLQHGIPEDRIVVSFERKMSCGIGKCGHCKIDNTYICLEGPVFAYPQSRRLLD